MQLDSKTLVALSELTDGDMRATLNTLQFIKRSGNKTINIDTIKTVAVGLRDQEKYRDYFLKIEKYFNSKNKGTFSTSWMSSFPRCLRNDPRSDGTLQNSTATN